MKTLRKNLMTIAILWAGIASSASLFAQTDADAIMMNKKQFCEGLTYEHSSWDNYWEGTFKRDNQNLGTVSTQSVMYMGTYGITNKLNVMAMAPYVWTKVTEGTLHSQKGFQDISVVVKWKPIKYSFGKNQFSLFALGGFSTPLTNYIIDYLPLSIGLGTTNLTAKGMIDYKHRRFTITGSAAYTWRSNIKIDRNSYYDTELRLTNEVKMPNLSIYQLRSGYRGRYLIAEAVLTKMVTLGGFDIRKNDMPFPSNRMNSTMVGGNVKYTLKKFTELAIVGGANYTISGRNVGQSTSFDLGVFYAFYFGKKTKS
ncbi:MAG TPA: hypothetical protein VGI82_01495 [Chitinophagaceae bacterium]